MRPHPAVPAAVGKITDGVVLVGAWGRHGGYLAGLFRYRDHSGRRPRKDVRFKLFMLHMNVAHVSPSKNKRGPSWRSCGARRKMNTAETAKNGAFATKITEESCSENLCTILLKLLKVWNFLMVQATGVEPVTSGSTIRRSNQLSYACTVRGAETSEGSGQKQAVRCCHCPPFCPSYLHRCRASDGA